MRRATPLSPFRSRSEEFTGSEFNALGTAARSASIASGAFIACRVYCVLRTDPTDSIDAVDATDATRQTRRQA